MNSEASSPITAELSLAAAGADAVPITPLSRLLSITFDDGFLRGSEVACEILAKHGLAATFYVVTGWVEPARTAIREKFNAGRPHGDWEYWRGVAAAGHEIGSHTFSHINAGGRKAVLLPWLVPNELRTSRDDLAREIPQARYTLSMPWNSASRHSERVARQFYAACRLGASAVCYNRLAELSPYGLASWAPISATPVAAYEKAIASIPAGGWLVLQFHSFDDEGWEPVSRDMFDTICRLAASEPGVVVAPVARIVGEAAP